MSLSFTETTIITYGMELYESENARYALGMSEDNNETARVEVAFGEVGKFLRSLHVSKVPSKAASPTRDEKDKSDASLMFDPGRRDRTGFTLNGPSKT